MRSKNEKLWNHLKSNLRDYKVEAGWFENTRYDDNTPVAYIAAVQNYGTAQAGKGHTTVIPARPFMDNAQNRVKGTEGKQILLQEMLRVFEGKQTMEQATNRLALWAKGVIQEEIKNLTSPPLAEATIKNRERRYKSKSKQKKKSTTIAKPLVDTGIMLATVQSKVTKLN